MSKQFSIKKQDIVSKITSSKKLLNSKSRDKENKPSFTKINEKQRNFSYNSSNINLTKKNELNFLKDKKSNSINTIRNPIISKTKKDHNDSLDEKGIF